MKYLIDYEMKIFIYSRITIIILRGMRMRSGYSLDDFHVLGGIK